MANLRIVGGSESAPGLHSPGADRRATPGSGAGRAWPRVAVRLGCLMCPPGTFEKLSPFLLSEIAPASGGQLLCDSLAHLRRHAALPLAGVVVTGAGAASYALMSASVAFRATWGLVGLLLVLAALVVVPRAESLRGGCPYALEASPRTPPPRLRVVSKLIVPAGVTIMASPLLAPSNPAAIAVPGVCGAVVCGAGLLAVAGAGRGGPAWFRLGIYLTAAGAALIAYANAASAFVSATQVVDAVASVVSAAGLVLYAATARDLARLYTKRLPVLPALTGAPAGTGAQPGGGPARGQP